MIIFWLYYDYTIFILYLFYEDMMILWLNYDLYYELYHDCTMIILWLYYDYTMIILWYILWL